MILIDETLEKEHKKVRLLAIVFLIASPVFLFYLALRFDNNQLFPENGDTIYYILLSIAILEPFLYQIVERVMMKRARQGKDNKITPAKMYLNISIIRFALVNAIFIYGFICVLIIGVFELIYFFYIYGMIWVVIYWPRRSYLETFVTRMEAP